MKTHKICPQSPIKIRLRSFVVHTFPQIARTLDSDPGSAQVCKWIPDPDTPEDPRLLTCGIDGVVASWTSQGEKRDEFYSFS